MHKIKGALLMEFVRLIRDNKDRDWKKYLSEEDMKVVFGTVMPNAWYPLEIYEHAGLAIYTEIAQSKPENAKVWGRYVIEDLGKRFYHNLIRNEDPMGAIERCMTFLQHWFKFDDPDFQAIRVEKVSPNRAKVTIRYDHPLEFFEAYAYQSCGQFERIVELNGGKDARVEIVQSDYKNASPFMVLMISWT
jgi:hypothetical protein